MALRMRWLKKKPTSIAGLPRWAVSWSTRVRGNDGSPCDCLAATRSGARGSAPLRVAATQSHGEPSFPLTLVDHETAHLGDPAMDVGFFFSHLVLKAMRSPSRWHEWKSLIYAALQGWWDETTRATREDIDRRSLTHLAVCLLARVDGTSPVDYLDEPTRDAVRWLGRSLLLEPIENWNAALDRVARALGRIRDR